MAALKRRLATLKDLIARIPASTCPSCRGFGYPSRYLRPLIDYSASNLRFGQPVRIQDERLDETGHCRVCGAESLLAPTVELELPRVAQAHARRLC